MSVALYWFRNDLRVSDHPGLTAACRSDSVLTAYCLNPGHFATGDYGVKRTGHYRARFLLASEVKEATGKTEDEVEELIDKSLAETLDSATDKVEH